MRNLMWMLALIVVLTGCSDPLATIPGGKLTGEVGEPPDSWAEVPQTVQLESRPDDPYSVNIWAAGLGADLYVATKDAKWIEFIAADARVRVRMGTSVYELKADRVLEDEEIARVFARYIEKYEVDEDDDWFQVGQVFRLDRR